MRDLRAMSPTIYQSAPPRVVDIWIVARAECETGAVVATDTASENAVKTNF